ncbi:MAG: hypothetical protein ABI430_01965 [Candidatus Taylorbacteria bacterium]
MAKLTPAVLAVSFKNSPNSPVTQSGIPAPTPPPFKRIDVGPYQYRVWQTQKDWEAYCDALPPFSPMGTSSSGHRF